MTKQDNHCLQCDSLQMECSVLPAVIFSSLLICIVRLKTEFAESINHRINVGLFVLLKGVKVTCDLVEGEEGGLRFVHQVSKMHTHHCCFPHLKNRTAKGQTCAFSASETVM